MPKKYIDADALIAEREEEIVDYDEDLQKHFMIKAVPTEYIEDFPPADVEEVKHGEWVRDADLIDRDVWVRWSCSECGYVRTRGWENTGAGAKPRVKLCEVCGAKMDRKENNNVKSEC